LVDINTNLGVAIDSYYGHIEEYILKLSYGNKFSDQQLKNVIIKRLIFNRLKSFVKLELPSILVEVIVRIRHKK
jgi:hypothetical protein